MSLPDKQSSMEMLLWSSIEIPMTKGAHRGKPLKNSNGQRHIYARFCLWKDSDQVK